jgi:hypothetical protein
MTTHSPSTVSLTPKESLFEMRRKDDPRIRHAPNKERAVALLTDGFIVVQEATQTVLLEGQDDPPFYNLVWELLTQRSITSDDGPLEPYPNLVFVHNEGKQSVKQLVPKIRSWGLKRFHGIIDKDRSNTSADGIHVIKRNAIENYLFDPLSVYVFLHFKGKAPPVRGVSVPRGGEGDVRKLPREQLQEIVNYVLGRVEGSLTTLSVNEKNIEEVVFVNGMRLHYPRWFLYRDDKEIAKGFRDTFPQHGFSPQDLRQSYATLNMVPQELLDIFEMIQASGKP